MKKYKIGWLLLILLLGFTLTSCKKNVEVEKSFPEIISELDSYILEANYETIFPSGTRECKILVYYQSPANYRVELTNPNINEKQIMIKNNDGVFVIVPSINKTFKVNSEWPNNSSQPYLLHSLCHDIVSDNNIITTNNGKETTLELKTKMFSGNDETKQKIIFDNDTKLPKEVIIYNSDDSVIATLKINRIDKNIDINKDMFVIEDTLTTSRVDFIDDPIEFDRAISYPTYCPEGTTLKEEVITGGDSDKRVIMNYHGTTTFTIVEEYVTETTSLKTEYCYGDIYVLGGAFAFVTETSMKFYDHGVEYTLASTTTPKEVLVLVAESLRTSELK